LTKHKMAQFFRLLLLTVVVVSVAYSSVDLSFSSSPPNFEIGLTKDITITCHATINITGPGMMYLTALVIYNNDTDDSLASVSVVSPNGKVIPPFNGSVSGLFNITGDSYVTIVIKDVDQNDTGGYRCEASGIDVNNLVSTADEYLNISSHTPDNKTYLSKISAIQAKVDNLTVKTQRWTHIDQNPLFTRFNFGKTTYLLSKSELGHVSMSQFICFVQGGYLAEVNDVDEFTVVRSQLMKELNGTGNDVMVWLGTTDSAVEGQWVHRYHPKDPVYSSWSVNSGDDCMAMTSRTDFHHEDLDCHEPGLALCEIDEDS